MDFKNPFYSLPFVSTDPHGFTFTNLQKQYERYLLTLWNRKRQEIHPTSNLGTTIRHSSPLSAKQDRSLAYPSSNYNSSAYGNELSFNYPRFHALSNHAINPSPSFNYHHNQSYFRELPSSQAENSIRTNNYRTTGAVAIDPYPQFSYPSTLQVRYDDLTQIPQYQQSVEKKSFYHNDSAINNDDMNLPTTVNSIYSRNDLQQQQRAPQFSSFDKKSAGITFHPIYQHNNQPLENHNYNSHNLNMSETVYGKQFITPAPSTDSFMTQLSPQSTRALSAPSAENLFKSNAMKSPSSNDTTTNVHMSDGDEETESDGEKCNITRKNIRRIDSISDDMFHQKPFVETKDDASASFTKHDDPIDNLHFQPECSVKRPQGKHKSSGGEIGETSTINESTTKENMHQIWEKVVPVDDEKDTQLESNFVIPKIIVESQIDLTEAPAPIPVSLVRSTMVENQDTMHESHKLFSPETLLNHDTKKHSTDNQQNGSLSYRPALVAPVNNNLPLETAEPSIYHFDKQPFSDEQQNRTTSSVERELTDFNIMKISDCTKKDLGKAEATQIMTYEFEIKSNNSLAKGISDDVRRGCEERKEAKNNNNDDKNQSTTSTTVALNDKISEIYRKIGRIEGDYYDEKSKIN